MLDKLLQIPTDQLEQRIKEDTGGQSGPGRIGNGRQRPTTFSRTKKKEEEDSDTSDELDLSEYLDDDDYTRLQDPGRQLQSRRRKSMYHTDTGSRVFSREPHQATGYGADGRP